MTHTRSRPIARWALALGIGLATPLAAVSQGMGGPNGYGPGSMGGGMMGGGMMGGSGPRSGYNGNQEQGSAELNSPAGKLYTQTCARCHALPNPRQHTADQWPAVVARMEQHMQQARQPLAPEDEIREINKFLAQHANGGK